MNHKHKHGSHAAFPGVQHPQHRDTVAALAGRGDDPPSGPAATAAAVCPATQPTAAATAAGAADGAAATDLWQWVYTTHLNAATDTS